MAQAATTPATVEVEGRARAERTLNMYPVLVTLDMSRLSGWLNADAYCQVKKGKGEHRRRGDMRASRREGGAGWSVAQAATRPATVEVEGRARAERTPNMYPVRVTLDMSTLSGWLNADAYCRVTKGKA